MFERSELHFLGWGSDKNKIYNPDEIGRKLRERWRKNEYSKKLERIRNTRYGKW